MGLFKKKIVSVVDETVRVDKNIVKYKVMFNRVVKAIYNKKVKDLLTYNLGEILNFTSISGIDRTEYDRGKKNIKIKYVFSDPEKHQKKAVVYLTVEYEHELKTVDRRNISKRVDVDHFKSITEIRINNNKESKELLRKILEEFQSKQITG